MKINNRVPYNFNIRRKNIENRNNIDIQSISCPKNQANLSCKNIQSLFLPSFGQLKKVGEAYLTDRTTGKQVTADIKKENILNEYIGYKLFVGQDIAGFIDISVNDKFPEYNNLIPSYENEIPYERFPQIIHLRTYEGQKYSGIGTTLVNLATEESKKLGKKGALWLNAEKGYLMNASKYRSNENPIPFYYKLGFRAPGKEDEKIKKVLKTEEYDMLPSTQLLYLSPDAINRKNKYHEINYLLYK